MSHYNFYLLVVLKDIPTTQKAHNLVYLSAATVHQFAPFWFWQCKIAIFCMGWLGAVMIVRMSRPIWLVSVPS